MSKQAKYAHLLSSLSSTLSLPPELELLRVKTQRIASVVDKAVLAFDPVFQEIQRSEIRLFKKIDRQMELVVRAMQLGGNPSGVRRPTPFLERCRQGRPPENYHGLEPLE